VISPQGKRLDRLGASGTGPGKFDFVSFDRSDPYQLNSAIAAGPDGRIYVVDDGNDRVEELSRTGGFVRQYGRSGSGEGALSEPTDVAIDAAGDVFVADDNGLSKFSPNGDFRWRVGGRSSTDPDLVGPFHVNAVDPHDRVIVASESARGLVYIGENGDKMGSLPVGADLHGGSTCNATVTDTGYAVVTSCGSSPNVLLVFDHSEHLVGRWSADLPEAPRFAPGGYAFAITEDDTILKLKVALPDA